MLKIIAFDMDGTIADLYSVEDWLPKLRAEDPSPYLDAEPMVDMDELNETLALLQKAGYEIQVITCLSKDASPEYKAAIREAKKAWLDKWGFIYDHFHGIDYRANKTDCLRRQMKTGPAILKMARMVYPDADFPEAILIDDEARHREAWKWGDTIDPTETDLLAALAALLPGDLRENG